MAKEKNIVTAKVFKSQRINVEKALHATNVDLESRYTDRIAQPNNMDFLLNFRNYNTMLGQCINAYSMNVVGRGYYLQYKGNEAETDAMTKEWEFVEALLEDFGVDELSFTKVLQTAYEHKLATGNGYIEVIRDLAGRAVEIDFVTPTYMYLMPKGEPIQITTKAGVQKYRKFRKFVQQVNGDIIYFKEFGDPRIMDRRNGQYVESLDEEYQANEIIHLKDVDNGEAYGQTRWMGHLLHMQTARKAEELNYRYFVNGKHTPIMITITGGQLSEESEAALTEYLNSIGSEQVQHQMLLLEIDKIVTMSDIDGKSVQPQVQVQNLTVQQDGLFQELITNSDDKLQSAFSLPDLYVGKTREINRATAETTIEHAENSIFASEREAFEHIVNKQLLAEYNLQFVEVKFNKQPQYSNVEGTVTLLEKATAAGALTINELREEFGQLLGKEYEPFPEEEANQPTTISATPAQDAQPTDVQQQDQQMMDQQTQDMMGEQLQKNWLKEARDALVQFSVKDDDSNEY